MRALALLLASFALCSVARAQTPDPTDPARYYPLDVGNVWEYAYGFNFDPPQDVRLEIVRDTIIDGNRYFMESYGDPYSGVPDDFATPIRFDSLTSTIVSWHDGQEYRYRPWNGVCRLDAPLGPEVDCQGNPFDVRGGLGTTVALSDSTRIQVVALKVYASPSSVVFDTYAADVGLIQYSDLHHGGEMRLRYARIRGVEYGTPFAVSAEAPASGTGLALSTRGRRLVLAAADPGPVRVDLFDVLGRHVARLMDARLGAETRTLSLPTLAAGVYVARAVQGTARASTRVVVTR